MKRDACLFILWAIVGAAFTVGVLYAFTPFGLLVLAASAAAIYALEGRGFSRTPAAFGALAGPGLFCLLVAAGGAQRGWLYAGIGLVGLALACFLVAGRIRCARAV